MHQLPPAATPAHHSTGQAGPACQHQPIAPGAPVPQVNPPLPPPPTAGLRVGHYLLLPAAGVPRRPPSAGLRCLTCEMTERLLALKGGPCLELRSWLHSQMQHLSKWGETRGPLSTVPHPAATQPLGRLLGTHTSKASAELPWMPFPCCSLHSLLCPGLLCALQGAAWMP